MSPEQARTILKQQYAAIGSVKPVGGEINLEFLEALLNKVTVKDRAVFSRQFSVMINAGVAIVRCVWSASTTSRVAPLLEAIVVVGETVTPSRLQLHLVLVSRIDLLLRKGQEART